jgi:site-specific DNA-methyltransferase (adenine-specific)
MPISEVYMEDCNIGMRKFTDNFFDLAIVDPPYGINAPNMNMGSNPARKDGGSPSESTANKLRKRRLNNGAGKLADRSINTMKIDWDFEKPSEEYFIELFRVSKNQIIWGGNYFDLRPSRCVICLVSLAW